MLFFLDSFLKWHGRFKLFTRWRVEVKDCASLGKSDMHSLSEPRQSSLYPCVFSFWISTTIIRCIVKGYISLFSVHCFLWNGSSKVQHLLSAAQFSLGSLFRLWTTVFICHDGRPTGLRQFKLAYLFCENLGVPFILDGMWREQL